MTTASHGKLNNNKLVEVLFELRYNTTRATRDVKNSLFESLQAFYTDPEELTQEFVHFQVGPKTDWKPVRIDEEPQDLIQYRFKARDDNRLVQLGRGIFSFNELSYSGFDMFLKNLKEVLDAHQIAADPSSYRRLGLRYINHFPLRSDPESIFRWAAQIPRNLSRKEDLVSNYQQTVIRFDATGFQNIVVTYPQLDAKESRIIVLDIEHFLDFHRPVEPNIELLISWLLKAHLKVWETFVEAVDARFMEELK